MFASASEGLTRAIAKLGAPLRTSVSAFLRLSDFGLRILSNRFVTMLVEVSYPGLQPEFAP